MRFYPAAASDINLATVVLDNDEIKALPSTEIELIANPGAGLLTLPLWALLVTDFDPSGDYTNVNVPAASLFIGNSVVFLEPIGGFPEGSNVWDLYALLGTAQRRALLLHPERFVLTEPDAVWGADGYVTSSAVRSIGNPGAVSISAWNDNGGDFASGHAENLLKITICYTTVAV